MNHQTALETFYDDFPIAMLVTDLEGRIIFANHQMISITSKEASMIHGRLFADVFPDIEKQCKDRFSESKEDIINCQINHTSYLLQIVENKDYQYYLFYNETYLDKLIRKTDLFQNMNEDLKAIFENTYDVIYVSDGDGKTLRVSSACERLWGITRQEVIGTSVYELEQTGVYKPSVTRLVLEQGKQIQALQTTKSGRRLFVVGTPIKDEDGKITRVINTSRDITDIDQLQAELNETRGMLKGYIEELKLLRQQQRNNQLKIVYRSPKMKNTISLAKKIADVNSTVLISGDSGAGKEMIARYIHEQGEKFDEPFVMVNCATLPEHLLEEELFGKENGLLESTSKGTLLLDEIDEIPLHLQSKLFRLLTEMQNDTNNSMRMIAITNQDLHEKVQAVLFRKDLFYFLNVIPIHVPSLQERKDDILPLTMLFMNHFNQLYSMNKQLSHDTMEHLLNYSWPGNVRELKNLIERLIVTSPSDVIPSDHLPGYLLTNSERDDIVHVTKIAPMNKTIEETEKKLLKMALDKYKTTTQIAKALDVNQSTISRKINKYFRKS